VVLEDHRLRLSEKRTCRGAFGVKREAINAGWSKSHKEELQIYDLYHVFLDRTKGGDIS
jgi:hypothetical protein